MGVFVLGILIGAVVGGRLMQRVDAFQGSRGALAKAVETLTGARKTMSGARGRLVRFAVLLALVVLAAAYGWSHRVGA